jgi:pimeloyl-CoA synthetase
MPKINNIERILEISDINTVHELIKEGLFPSRGRYRTMPMSMPSLENDAINVIMDIKAVAIPTSTTVKYLAIRTQNAKPNSDEKKLFISK